MTVPSLPTRKQNDSSNDTYHNRLAVFMPPFFQQLNLFFFGISHAALSALDKLTSDYSGQ
jgi:hypothetical protein